MQTNRLPVVSATDGGENDGDGREGRGQGQEVEMVSVLHPRHIVTPLASNWRRHAGLAQYSERTPAHSRPSAATVAHTCRHETRPHEPSPCAAAAHHHPLLRRHCVRVTFGIGTANVTQDTVTPDN